MSVELTVDDIDENGGVAADESGTGELHVIGHTGDDGRVVDCRRGRGHGHEHRLVPVGVFLHPLRIFSQSLGLGGVHCGDESSDIAECIAVGR